MISNLSLTRVHRIVTIVFRQTSDYICPSRFWVETPEEKERLLGDYKKNLGHKECKYFNKVSSQINDYRFMFMFV